VLKHLNSGAGIPSPPVSWLTRVLYNAPSGIASVERQNKTTQLVAHKSSHSMVRGRVGFDFRAHNFVGK
jgi:hypothetical protein